MSIKKEVVGEEEIGRDKVKSDRRDEVASPVSASLSPLSQRCLVSPTVPANFQLILPASALS